MEWLNTIPDYIQESSAIGIFLVEVNDLKVIGSFLVEVNDLEVGFSEVLF